MNHRPTVILGVLLLSVLSAPAFAASAANKVSEGLDLFKAKKYEKAAKAFAEAETAKPDDSRILFNLACAKAAEGDLDKAAELYQQVAQTPESELAVLARYNMGCLSVDRAKQALGAKPEDASPEARTQGMDHLKAAAGYFRDCIEMNSEFDDARRNLELLRTWTKHMKSLWREKDRQKLRDSMDLMQFLKWIEGQEGTLRGGVKALSRAPDSPRRRQACYMTASKQRELGEEIPHLKTKIGQALTQAQAGPQGPQGMAPGPQGMQAPQAMAAPAADAQKAAEVLTTLADEAHGAMGKAAEALDARSLDSAKQSQGAVLERLDDIHTAMLPYPKLVFQSVDKEKGLVAAVGAEVDPKKTEPAQPQIAKEKNEPADAGQSPDKKTVPTALDTSVPEEDTASQPPAAPFDAAETAWNQRFISRWAPVMIGKARQGLQQMKSMPPIQSEVPKTLPPPPKTAAQPGKEDAKDAKPDEPQMTEEQKKLEAAKKQRENMKKSMELALKHGPKIIELSEQAAADLENEDAKAAYPKQQEALKLLEEIAKPLKDQQKQQQQQKQDQKQQDQKQNQQQNKDQQNKNQNKDQNKDQKNKDDQKKQDQKKDDQKKKDQDKKDQNKKNQDKKDQKKDKQKQPSKPDKPQKDKAKQKPEKKQPAGAKPDQKKRRIQAKMRQVRARQKEGADKRKALQLMIGGPEDVDKDW